MQKILVIQTAFIGDVVLATAMVEKLARYFPDAEIDFMVRKGNEGLLENNPWLHGVIIWDKKKNKYSHLLELIRQVRKNRYDKVINLQRFFTTGFLTAFSGARQTIGFNKNPLSFLFSKSIPHIISTQPPYKLEVERNNDLIAAFTDDAFQAPKLYPSARDMAKVKPYQQQAYITISPSSVWFTKRYPFAKWVDFLNTVPSQYKIYLLGGKENREECDELCEATVNKNITTLAGELSFLQSAALMQGAAMNYVNDSAPLHFASAMNAPVTAVFCSTVRSFGFTPLSDKSFVVETTETLDCRPCGLHGKKECPQKHFKCGLGINNAQLLATLNA